MDQFRVGQLKGNDIDLSVHVRRLLETLRKR